MRVGIISERALTDKHGTGAQLLRLFAGSEVDFFHMYFLPGHGNVSDCSNSYNLMDQLPQWANRRGVAKLYRTFTPTWWGADCKVRHSKMLKLQREHNLQCDVAYVIVGWEDAARRCLSLLSHLNCPYVVHIMDVYHDNLNPDAMPGFKQLLDGAVTVIAITPTIAEQVAKFNVNDIRNVFIGQDTSAPQACPPVSGQAIQVIMAGRPYRGGVELLEKALPKISLQYPQVSFAYVGADFEHHSSYFKQIVHNYGFIKDRDTYLKLLAKSHFAYLTGPSELDNMGLYSFPSRTSDYLMAGLPMLACIAAGSATDLILQPLVPGGVNVVHTPQQLIDSLGRFLATENAWCAASQQCRQFALNTMNIDVVRMQIFDALRQASQSL